MLNSTVIEVDGIFVGAAILVDGLKSDRHSRRPDHG